MSKKNTRPMTLEEAYYALVHGKPVTKEPVKEG